MIGCISDFRQSCTLEMAGRRAKRSEIWASGMSIQCVQDTCDVECLIPGVIRCISDFRQPCDSKTAGPRVKDYLDLYVIHFYVVIVFHLVKQSTKPLGFLLYFYIYFFSIFSNMSLKVCISELGHVLLLVYCDIIFNPWVTF